LGDAGRAGELRPNLVDGFPCVRGDSADRLLRGGSVETEGDEDADPAFAAAAVITAGIIAFNFLSSSNKPLTEEEITNYVYQEGIIEDLTDEDILEYAFLNTSKTDTTSNREVETIQDYLLDQGLDESDIINEL
jgi:hypothetical protein